MEHKENFAHPCAQANLAFCNGRRYSLDAQTHWAARECSKRYYYRKFGLHDAIFAKSNAVLTTAMQGGVQLTRAEISQVYRKSIGIDPTGLRLAYLLMRAELDAIICSGALRDKQFTYALLDEKVPKTKLLDNDEVLAELTKNATLQAMGQRR